MAVTNPKLPLCPTSSFNSTSNSMKFFTRPTAHPYGRNVSDQSSLLKCRKCILHKTERNDSWTQRRRKSHRIRGLRNLGQQKFGFQLNLLGATLKATMDQLIAITSNIFSGAVVITWVGYVMNMVNTTKNLVSICGRNLGRTTRK